MRWFLPAAAAALAVTTLAGDGARADEDDAEDGGERRVYVAAGSELDFAVARAPLPTERLGAIALADVERASAGDDADARGAADPLPEVLGAAPEGALPDGWPRAGLDGHDGAGRGAAPLAAREGKRGRCRCATAIGDVSGERVAALYASRTFTVGDELSRVRLLTLRAQYGDGLVAWINGREVARRSIDRDAGPMDTADRPHGPEWETFYIPVVPGLLRRGDNVLAVEVRPSEHGLAPRLDLELASATGARIVRGPMIQRVGPTTATVVYDTDLPVPGAVEYGADATLGRTARSAGGGLAVHHEIELTGLPEHGAVHYRVGAGGDVSDTFVFHTAPRAARPIRLVVYGDMRGGHDTHRKIVERVVDDAPDLVIATGDLVLRGTDEGDWQRFFDVAGALLPRIPFYPAVGNHDMGKSGDERRRMNEIFALWSGPDDRPSWGHWYSFDVADVHVVMLDSNAYEHDIQREWLEDDLRAARARGVRAIVAAAHDGPYSHAIHRGDPTAAELYAPILTRYGVDVIFSGHDHVYERGEKDGLRYIVSGGAGAPLYALRCGVAGKKRCPKEDGVRHVAREHHYVLVTIFETWMRVCPKRVDGTPLEACVKYELNTP